MKGLKYHVRDEQLFDGYLARQGSEEMDPRTRAHLDHCDECQVRYGELVSFMDRLRADGEAEVDLVFDADRLHAQQAQIKRRMENIGHVAHVISFPVRVGRRVSATAARVAPRWVAGAAAAGLFIGAAAGHLYDVSRVTSHRSGAVGAPSRVAATASPDPYSDSSAVDDLTFMSDLDVALAHPRTRELVPLDEMTPHVRELRGVVR